MRGPLGMMKQTSHVVKGRARLLSRSQNVSPLSGPQTGFNHRYDTARAALFTRLNPQ